MADFATSDSAPGAAPRSDDTKSFAEGAWHKAIKVHGLRMSWFGSHGQPSFFFLLLFRLGAGAKAKEKEGKGNPRKEQGETAESWEQVIAKRKGKEEEGQC